MGVDKPNVRFIINYGLPKTLESYFQQSGRGGRDGEPAVSIIFWSQEDFNRNRFFANCFSTADSRSRERLDCQLINDYVMDTVTCRRKILLSYFGEKYDGDTSIATNEECCDNCSNRPRTRKDLSSQARFFISAVKSAGYPSRRNIFDHVQKVAKEKMWLYSLSWWQELLLLLKVEGYLEFVVDSELIHVTPKGLSSLTSKEPITLPATSTLVSELYDSGKIVIPTVKVEDKENSSHPAKRVLPSSFGGSKISVPNKKKPLLIDKISQARKNSGSSRYTGSKPGFV